MARSEHDILKHMYNACDPFDPASSEYYLDCSDARGSGAFVNEFVGHLRLANDKVCTLFTGHIGCGKSSELRELARHLRDNFVGEKRYLPVLIDTSEYLDEYDVTLPDLLLAVVTELVSTLREQAGVNLRESYISSRLADLKGLLLADVEFAGAEASLFGVKTKIVALKRDSQARTQVRAALKPHPARLLDEINALFDKARAALRKKEKADDLVLIVDNLEKIRRFDARDEGSASYRELFIERAPQLTRLDVHTVYTVPLRLARSHGPVLSARYDRDPFVLPMVKVMERRTRASYAAGVTCVREILAKRLAPGKLDEVFAEGAMDFLIEYSGGNLRHLFQFVQEACTRTRGLPVPLDVAHRAVQGMVRSFSTAIPEGHWARLAQLEKSESQSIDNGDPDFLELLEMQAVLEYLNGPNTSGSFAENEPWYAVHPIVRELQKFKRAVAAHKTDG